MGEKQVSRGKVSCERRPSGHIMATCHAVTRATVAEKHQVLPARQVYAVDCLRCQTSRRPGCSARWIQHGKARQGVGASSGYGSVLREQRQKREARTSRDHSVAGMRTLATPASSRAAMICPTLWSISSTLSPKRPPLLTLTNSGEENSGVWTWTKDIRTKNGWLIAAFSAMNVVVKLVRSAVRFPYLRSGQTGERGMETAQLTLGR